VYGVRKVSAGTVVLNYGVTNRPTSSSRRTGDPTETKKDCAVEDHQQFTGPGY
jgi:hypothetical protein